MAQAHKRAMYYKCLNDSNVVVVVVVVIVVAHSSVGGGDMCFSYLKSVKLFVYYDFIHRFITSVETSVDF